jgi:ferredoxin-NADP reductase
VLTLPIRDVIAATPRARILQLDLQGQRFDYHAGQAVMLGSHGQPHRKPYSLAIAPEDAQRGGVLELLIGVDDIGSAGLHLHLNHGGLVDVEGPIGRFTFPDHPAEGRFLFIAGGTGIAPLRAMLRHALGVPHEHIGLMYSARTPDDFAYEQEFLALAAAGTIELRQTVTRDVPHGNWKGLRGRIGAAALEPLVHHPATLCFVCGPPQLVSEIPAVLGELGVPGNRIRIEEWSRS